jgi:hypothetical protein
MHSPAPVPLRRPGPRELRRPLPRVKPPVPRPASSDDTQSLGSQAVTGALFSPPGKEKRAEREESTGITLPPKGHPGRAHGGGRRIAAPERELSAALLLTLLLSATALLYGRIAPGTLSATDLLLAGAVLLSGLGLLILGYSARRRGPVDGAKS